MDRDSQLMDAIVWIDAVTGMKALPAASIPLTVTSPPYDGLRKFGGHPWDFPTFEAIAEELWRITCEGGVVVWVVADQIKDGSCSGTSFRQLLHFKELGFRLHDTLIMRRSGSRWSGRTRYGTALEFAFVFSKGSPRSVRLIRDKENKHKGMLRAFVRREMDGRLRRAGKSKPVAPWGVRGPIWEYSAGHQSTTKDLYAFEHSALMPEQMAEDHILSWSRPGDLVFEPMCGAGTTCKMALLNHRRYLGFEIHEPYYRLAVKRLGHAQADYLRRVDRWVGEPTERCRDYELSS